MVCTNALRRQESVLNNADLIVQTLQQAGVKWAFGVPSGPVLPLIEALHNSDIEYVLTTSETSAGFMAQTIGAMTGVPGVAIATLGSGATNLATGVGAAWLDRSPMIAITCNVETAMLERRIQMRIDHQKLFEPLTKASFSLRAGDVAETLSLALRLATEEPPGPVHIDLPEDVALEQAAAPGPMAQSPSVREPSEPEAIPHVADLLSKSKRPLLVCGLELTRVGQRNRLVEFIETQNLPFILTLHAKGFLPESHANYAGVLGRARRSDVARFVDEADLIVAVGYDPIEINYEEWVGDLPVVHLGLQAAEAGNFTLALNASGDLERAIDGIASLPAYGNE